LGELVTAIAVEETDRPPPLTISRNDFDQD